MIRISFGQGQYIESDPGSSLVPVDQSVIDAVAAEVAAADREWRRVR